MSNHLSIDEAAKNFPPSTWQYMLFDELKAVLTNPQRPFPCVFGTSGFKANQLRVAFPDPLTPETLAPILSDFVANSGSYGRFTGLVVFARPGPVRSMETYRDQFWELLDGLERIDTAPRPADIPREIDDPAWEFCFGGEAMFVSNATPAHVLRQSRRSTSFLNVFLPRWVFDGIIGSDEPAAVRSIEMIRERLKTYDGLPVFPDLGFYGDDTNREYEQYFIDDTNAKQRCPFHELGGHRGPVPATARGLAKEDVA